MRRKGRGKALLWEGQGDPRERKARVLDSVSQLQGLRSVLHLLTREEGWWHGAFRHEWASVFHRPKCSLEGFYELLGSHRLAGLTGEWAWPAPGGKGGTGLFLRSEGRMRLGSLRWNGMCLWPELPHCLLWGSSTDHRTSVADKNMGPRSIGGQKGPTSPSTWWLCWWPEFSDYARPGRSRGSKSGALSSNLKLIPNLVMGWDSIHQDQTVLQKPGQNHRARNEGQHKKWLRFRCAHLSFVNGHNWLLCLLHLLISFNSRGHRGLKT